MCVCVGAGVGVCGGVCAESVCGMYVLSFGVVVCTLCCGVVCSVGGVVWCGLACGFSLLFSLALFPLLFSLCSLSATMTMITRPVGSLCVHTALTCECLGVRVLRLIPCRANMFASCTKQLS